MGVVASNAGATTPTAAPSSPQTLSIDVGTEADRQIALFLSYAAGFALGTSSVTVGTDTMSAISGAAAASGNFRVDTYGGLVTVTGTQTLSVSFANTPSWLRVYAIWVRGSDLINNGTATTDTNGSPANLAMTCAAGDMTVTAFIADTLMAMTTNFTSVLASSTLGTTTYDYDAGNTANPTHTWTRSTGSDWANAALVGVNFRAVGSNMTPSVVAAVLAGVTGSAVQGRRLTVPTP